MIHIVIRHAAVIAPHLVFRFKSAKAPLNQATDSILSLQVRECGTAGQRNPKKILQGQA